MGEFNVNKSDGSLEQTAGMPSEYPATQVMMPDGVTSVVEKMGNVRMTKLWENPSPTSAFAAQAIPVDVSEYQFVGIFMDLVMSLIRVGGGRTAIYREGFYNNNVILFRRVFNVDGANGIAIEDASSYTQGQGSATDNTKNIPTVIYGIKLT